jgi:hypothetical protein
MAQQTACIDQPCWYRRECRLICNTILQLRPRWPVLLVTTDHKRVATQKALANAHIHHYGWIRRNEDTQKKADQVSKYWQRLPRKSALA